MPGRLLDEATAPETYAIIGAMQEVHRILGPGFLETAYQEAVELELQSRGIPAEREVQLPICYKTQKLRTKYRADFLCYGSVLLELKAQSLLTAIDEAQVIHYLRTAGLPVALLANFGGRSLEVRRFVGAPACRTGYSVKSV